jgi:hypothetical protein
MKRWSATACTTSRKAEAWDDCRVRVCEMWVCCAELSALIVLQHKI